MKASEYRKQSSAELRDALEELRKEQFSLRMQKGTGQMFRPSQMQALRKDIARIKTILNEQKAGDAG